VRLQIARNTQPVMNPQPDALALALAERWRMVCQDVARFGGESELAPINSERWQRVNDTLEEMAVLLVGSVQNEEERIRLDAALQAIWTQLETQLLQFAELTEKSRLGSPRRENLTFWERQIAASARR
jgi:hypothetical protein